MSTIAKPQSDSSRSKVVEGCKIGCPIVPFCSFDRVAASIEDDDDEDDDEEEELMRELERIKQERAQEAQKKEQVWGPLGGRSRAVVPTSW